MALDFLIANAEYLHTTAIPVPDDGLAPADITIAMWWKDSGVQSWAFSSGYINSPGLYYGFLMNHVAANSCKCVRRSTTHLEALSTTVMVSGEWNHCFGRIKKTGDYSDCIVNGDLSGKATNTTAGTGSFSTSLPPGRVYIGRLTWSAGAQYTTGGMAECAIWNTLLTDADAIKLSKGYSPLFVRPEWLRFYAPLLNPANVGIDVIPANKHWKSGPQALTVVNAPTYIPHPNIIYPEWFAPWMNSVTPKSRRRSYNVPAAAVGLSIPVAMASYRRRRTA